MENKYNKEQILESYRNSIESRINKDKYSVESTCTDDVQNGDWRERTMETTIKEKSTNKIKHIAKTRSMSHIDKDENLNEDLIILYAIIRHIVTNEKLMLLCETTEDEALAMSNIKDLQ